MSDIDPFEERRLRLEQAEREARGDFSTPATAVKKKATGASGSVKKDDNSWLKYKKPSEDTDADESNPNAILNRQHNNLRAQAQLDLAMAAMLDTSMPRQER